MCTRMSPSASSARAIVRLPPPIPEPTIATMARRRSMATSPNGARSTSSGSRREGSSTVTDTETSEVATTSIDTRCRSNTSKMRRSTPCASSIRGDRTRTTVTSRLPAIAVTSRIGADAVIRVPRPAGFREL